MAEGDEPTGIPTDIVEQQKRAEAEEQITQATTKARVAAQELNDELERRNQLLEQTKQNLKDLEVLERAAVENAQKAFDKNQEQLRLAEQRSNAEVENLLAEEAGYRQRAEEAALEEERHIEAFENIQKEIQAQKELIKTQKQGVASIEKAIESNPTAKNIQEVGELSEEAKAKITSMGAAISDSFGKGKGGLAGQIIDIGQGMSDFIARSKEAIKTGGFFRYMLSGLPFAAAALIGVLGKMVLEIDNTSKSLGKATGFGDQFRQQIRAVGTETLAAGVSFREAGEAMGSLASEFSGFNPTNGKTNVHLTRTASLMTQLGVGTTESAKSMDIMNRAMGLSAETSADLTANIAMMGREIGITSTKMISKFIEANKRLARFGRDNIRVFKELSAVAKATGLEISTLTKISEGFDTFDKAAENAAKLNAFLGTSIDMIQMMNMNDAEQVLLIRQQVKARVGNFDSLDKFQKQMVASAMGLSSVEEAQRLLNMSTAEYQKYTSGMQEQADIQQELADAAREVVPMMQRFKLILMKLALVFTPLFDGLQALMTLFDYFGESMGKMGIESEILGQVLYYVFGALLVLAGVKLMAMAGILAKTVGFIIAFATAVGILVRKLMDFFDITHKTGSPMLYMLPEYMARGFDKLAKGAQFAADTIGKVKGFFGGLFNVLHQPGTGSGGAFWALGGVMADNFERMADSITRTSNALSKMISLMIEFAGIDFDGFIAVRTEGGATSMVMGSEGVLSAISEGKLTVDVNMPEIKLPKMEINIIVNSAKWEGIIDAKINERMGVA